MTPILRCVTGLAFLLCAAVSSGADVRIAVLTGEGERAASPAAVAQTEAALSAEKGVVLVERAQIRAIMTEQRLTAAGLTDPATAIRLGKLLSAQMFFTLDRVPKVTPLLCRVQVVEAATGVPLASAMIEESAIASGPREVAELAQRAVAKWGVPLEARRCVAVVSFNSEEPGQILDGTARALWMTLASDLQRSDDITVLDRDYLRRIQDEKGLADAVLRLRNASYLVEAALRRPQRKGALVVTVVLRPVSGGDAETVSIESQEDFGVLRQRVAETVSARIKARPAIRSAASPEQEAESYMGQALRLLYTEDDVDAAIRAVEAAYALAPGRKSRCRLASAYSRRVFGFASQRGPRGEWVHFSTATEADQVRSLEHYLRLLTVLNEQYDIDFQTPAPDRATRRNRNYELGVMQYAGLGVPRSSAKGAAVALDADAARLQRRLFDTAIAAAARDPENFGFSYWMALRGAVRNLFVEGSFSDFSPAEAEGLDKVFRLWIAGPRGRDDDTFTFAESLTVSMGPLSSLKRNEQARPLFAAVLQAYTGNRDPDVRLLAHHGLTIIGQDRKENAEAILAFYADGFRWADYPLGKRQQPFILESAMGTIRSLDPALAATYCERIIGPWTREGGEGWRIGVWRSLCDSWVATVRKTQGDAAADAIVERLVSGLQRALQHWPGGFSTEQEDYLHVLLSKRAPTSKASRAPSPSQQAPLDPPDPAWKDYEVRTLGLNLSGSADAALVDGDKLYCVVVDLYKNNRRVTITEHAFPDGGPAVRTESIDVPTDGSWIPSAEASPVRMGDCLYVGTMGGIVVMEKTGPLRLLTEADGLPGKKIMCMAGLEQRLYMGVAVKEGQRVGFGVYAPAARTGEMIFSNVALEAKRQNNSTVLAVLADPPRQCLWLALSNEGLFQYDARAAKLNPQPLISRDPGSVPYPPPPMVWSSGRILFLNMGIVDGFDPATGVKTQLLTQFGYKLPPPEKRMKRTDGKPMRVSDAIFGDTNVPIWPAVYDGTTLITSGTKPGVYARTMYLHRVDKEPAPYPMRITVVHFIATPHGILGMDLSGDAVLVRRR